VFVGHLGAGLLVKRMEPRLNLGALFVAALFVDMLLWVLVVLGVESVEAPETAGSARFLTFVFPYSHGLVANVLWAVLAAVVGWLLAGSSVPRRTRLAWALGVAVLSHFLLDLIVHVPDLPILGSQSPKLGLSLWRHMPIALMLELLLAAGALAIYLRTARLARGKALLIVGIVAVASLLTAVGPYMAGPVPPARTLAVSSFATLVVIAVLGFFVEGRFGVLAARRGMFAARQ